MKSLAYFGAGCVLLAVAAGMSAFPFIGLLSPVPFFGGLWLGSRSRRIGWQRVFVAGCLAYLAYAGVLMAQSAGAQLLHAQRTAFLESRGQTQSNPAPITPTLNFAHWILAPLIVSIVMIGTSEAGARAPAIAMGTLAFGVGPLAAGLVAALSRIWPLTA